ncbi:unnamed protein product, partial [Nesidiocoris tenuis]
RTGQPAMGKTTTRWTTTRTQRSGIIITITCKNNHDLPPSSGEDTGWKRLIIHYDPIRPSRGGFSFCLRDRADLQHPQHLFRFLLEIVLPEPSRLGMPNMNFVNKLGLNPKDQILCNHRAYIRCWIESLFKYAAEGLYHCRPAMFNKRSSGTGRVWREAGDGETIRRPPLESDSLFCWPSNLLSGAVGFDSRSGFNFPASFRTQFSRQMPYLGT